MSNKFGPYQIAGVSEHSQQCALLSAVAEFLNVHRDDRFLALTWLHAIPNGGDRNRIVAANMKAEGVKPGVADLFLPCARKGYHGFYIEMKNATGTQSPAQHKFETFVTREGYLYAVFHDWLSAFNALCWYMDATNDIFV